MSDVIIPVVRVLRGSANGEHLEFYRDQSAFDTEAEPAVGFPVIHIEELVGLVAFVNGEWALACVANQIQVSLQVLVVCFKVEPIFGIGHFVDGLGQSKCGAGKKERGCTLDMVTDLSRERHVCREVVVFAVEVLHQGIFFAGRKFSVLFVDVKS